MHILIPFFFDICLLDAFKIHVEIMIQYSEQINPGNFPITVSKYQHYRCCCWSPGVIRHMPLLSYLHTDRNATYKSSSLRWDREYLYPLPLSFQEPGFDKSMASFGKTVLILWYLMRFIYFYFSAAQPDIVQNTCWSDHDHLMHPPRPSKSSYVSLLGTSSAYNFIPWKVWGYHSEYSR